MIVLQSRLDSNQLMSLDTLRGNSATLEVRTAYDSIRQMSSSVVSLSFCPEQILHFSRCWQSVLSHLLFGSR